MISALAAALLAAQQPATPPSTYDRAVAARHSGDNQRAAELLAELVNDDPSNADAWVQYGYTLRALSRPRDAEIAFKKALELAPDYQDASDGLDMLRNVPTTRHPFDRAVTARREGNNVLAVEILEEMLASEPDNADALVQYGYVLREMDRPAEAEQAFRKALTIAPAYDDARRGLAFVRGDQRANLRYQVEASAAFVDLESGQEDWREYALALRYAPDVRRAFSARVEPTYRFGQWDTYGELRADLRFGDQYRVYLLAGGTPEADFRAKARIGGGGSIRLNEGSSPLVATLDAQYAEYPGAKVTVINPGMEKYFSGRGWVTARMINVFRDGEHLTGWFGRGDIQAAPKLRLFAGAANAPDLARGLPIDTKSLFGGAVIDISERTVLRFNIANDRPDIGAERTSIGVGLGLKFR